MRERLASNNQLYALNRHGRLQEALDLSPDIRITADVAHALISEATQAEQSDTQQSADEGQ